MRKNLRWLSYPVAALLLVFNLRRFLFTWAALLRRVDWVRPQPTQVDAATVLILAPCRDEARALPGLIESLARLDYPAECARVALLDDGSRDDTRAVMQSAARDRLGWYMCASTTNRGKAQALNEALAAIAFGEIVVVYDADHRPEPGALKRLVAAFDDPLVAGASGRTLPMNPTASWSAYYATVESAVHQMITMRAKDRLNLAPALLGSNCAYRRTALQEVGGFRAGALLEDSDLTLAFARAGHRLRFIPESIAWHRVPESIADFTRQHVRWARGFNDVARDHATATLFDPGLPLRLRAELTLFSLGYLDRLALLAALGMKLFDRMFHFPKVVLQIALLMPFVQIAGLFLEQRVSRAMWARFPLMPILFVLDIWVSLRAMFESLLKRPRVWMTSPRIRLSDE
jgi:cellulose synthase/poly-beta-1,6-N-acetylglucosamine synthase-like glycosyltransferase